MQTNAGSHLGPVRRISRASGPVRRISDHLDTVFRRPSLPVTATYSTTSSSNSTTEDSHKVSVAELVPSSVTEESDGDTQRSSDDLLPAFSNCSEPVNSRASTRSSVPVCDETHQLSLSNSTDPNASPSPITSKHRLVPVTQEEEDAYAFSVDDKDGIDKEEDGVTKEWKLESEEDEQRSHDGDDRPRSRSGVRSSSEGDLSMMSETSGGGKEATPLYSASTNNLMDNLKLHVRENSLEELSGESDYCECKHVHAHLYVMTVNASGVTTWLGLG